MGGGGELPEKEESRSPQVSMRKDPRTRAKVRRSLCAAGKAEAEAPKETALVIWCMTNRGSPGRGGLSGSCRADYCRSAVTNRRSLIYRLIERRPGWNCLVKSFVLERCEKSFSSAW